MNLNFRQKKLQIITENVGILKCFFRFLKQELNLSHLVSMNKNGIEVMIYMTMIASMLLLIYKKVNDLRIQNRQKTYCNGNSGYDYRYINHFCWRKSRQGF